MSVRHLISASCLCAALFIPHAVTSQSTPPPDPDTAKIVDVGGPPNSALQQKKHYVVLVSLDGFRYNYPQEWGAPNIANLASTGATATEGMLPSYPSVTFPNHFTIITGLYPEHHGLVGNTFYDPARNASYSYKDTKTNLDGTWYSGTPLWSLAEEQGMRAASFFWPGSEAMIAGERPDEYVHFDDKFDDEKRIDQVIAWLKLPPTERPHFITLYYSNTDHAGHNYGPDSDEEKEQVHHVDTLMGDLKQKLDATHLPIDLIILADHGMIKVQGDWITLDAYADLSHFKTDGAFLYPETAADAAKAYESFRAHPDPRFTVYRRADVPSYLHFNENPREGDPVIVPNGPYIFRAHDNSRKPPVGEHGYDVTRMPEMKALFVVNGPDIRPGTKLPSFPNVDVYDFIAQLLGLTPAPNDGEIKPLLPALKRPSTRPSALVSK
ncbi:ectonucleotide pyrophosphatase/phosphodiesterase [Granulicella sp. L60]|uniref:alkaline phosphatase family protein n=1 Tax=Granulicella sp. L60 TaxID=1641866 RepID=UPI0020B12A24|nr:ectonucleotide pyrophosphatase/phosphodiesterase [Granulicella sp. L60]